MPPPRHREREDFHRNRSSSPLHGKKRSWLSSSSSSTHDRSHQRSPPAKRKDFKSPPRPQQHTSSGFSRRSRSRSRSRSPKFGKRDAAYDEGYSRHASKDGIKARSPVRGSNSDFGSRHDSRSKRRSRSSSPRGLSKGHHDSYSRDRGQDDRKLKRGSQSPDFHGASARKKSRLSPPLPSPPVQKKSYHRSPSPLTPPRPTSSSKKHDSSSRKSRDDSLPQRKVGGSLGQKKSNRLTLHKRFTEEDLEPFQLQLKDNVTIAILRNPRAEPSDDVTVQRIFDSSLFKMVHKKSEGRKPIFDREEIKAWKHDENLEDDFEERRLVRVKATHKRPADSSLRMSPDALRKSLGSKDKSGSQSPHQSPHVRLNPQPDSRYESRYQQQIKRDEMRRKGGGGDGGRRGRGGRDDEEEGGRVARDGRLLRGDDNDLRRALERRKSGRDEDFDRNSREFSAPRNQYNHDDRNVVVDQDRARRFEDVTDRERGRERAFSVERRGRGRGRGRGPRRQWSPRRWNQDSREDFNSRDRGFDRRERYSTSPSSTRGRGGGFRGRGRDRDQSWYEQDDRSAPPADLYNKYLQHDDRDISPRSLRGTRGRGGRFQSNRGFRGARGWAFGAGRGRGFRGSGRGRGHYSRADSRSVEREDRRSIEHASDREWKHDLYDTVQSDDELPHSTTITN